MAIEILREVRGEEDETCPSRSIELASCLLRLYLDGATKHLAKMEANRSKESAIESCKTSQMLLMQLKSIPEHVETSKIQDQQGQETKFLSPVTEMKRKISTAMISPPSTIPSVRYSASTASRVSGASFSASYVDGTECK